MSEQTPPQTFSELQTEITRRHAGLSKRLQQVSHYVLENPDEVAFETLTVIAEKAGVHPSTLVRFANAFEYSGFSEMQKLFKAQFLEEHPSYSERIRLLDQDMPDDGDATPTPMRLLTEFTRANLQSLEQFHNQVPEQALNDAVELLAQARSIYVVGVRRSYAAAVYTTYALSHVERPTHLVDGAGGMLREQVRAIGPGDTVIGISFKPYGNETVTSLHTAKERGASVILVTDSQLSPAYQDADVAFLLNDVEVRSFRPLTTTLCLTQSLCIALAYRLEHQADTHKTSG